MGLRRRGVVAGGGVIATALAASATLENVQSYLTRSGHEVVFQKSILAKMRQLVVITKDKLMDLCGD